MSAQHGGDALGASGHGNDVHGHAQPLKFQRGDVRGAEHFDDAHGQFPVRSGSGRFDKLFQRIERAFPAGHKHGHIQAGNAQIVEVVHAVTALAGQRVHHDQRKGVHGNIVAVRRVILQFGRSDGSIRSGLVHEAERLSELFHEFLFHQTGLLIRASPRIERHDDLDGLVRIPFPGKPARGQQKADDGEQRARKDSGHNGLLR